MKHLLTLILLLSICNVTMGQVNHDYPYDVKPFQNAQMTILYEDTTHLGHDITLDIPTYYRTITQISPHELFLVTNTKDTTVLNLNAPGIMKYATQNALGYETSIVYKIASMEGNSMMQEYYVYNISNNYLSCIVTIGHLHQGTTAQCVTSTYQWIREPPLKNGN